MIASFNAETLKMRKRWANWILVGVLLAILVLLGYVISYVVLTNPPKGFRSEVAASVLKKEVFPENLIPNILVGMETIGAAIMIILGGLSIASEYGWVTIQTILIQKPGRLAVLFGKLLALALASLLVSLAVMGLAALTSYFLVKIDGSASNWPPAETIFKGFGALWLELSVWTAFGMFVGLAFRSTAAAIGGGLTYLFVIESLVGGLFRNTSWLKEVLKFLPGLNANGVNATFPYTFRNPNAATTVLVSGTRGTITLMVYLVLFVVVAALIFRTRDVGA
ncbi:MAG TPA: ABC transporter permease subunit [Candidatus Dormibacteraeota bacterium]|jgi:ABC-type transport system involved in multi-copper enzyme maturation permease subunit